MNIQPSFPYKGKPVYIDGLVTGAESLSVVCRNLTEGLRKNSVPAFALHYDPSSPDWTTGRHLTIEPPPMVDLAPHKYIYVDCGWPRSKELTLTSEQSVVITAIDDYRWKLPHVQHAWKAFDTILTFSRASQRWLKAGLKRKIGYFPLGVDRNTFYPKSTPVLPDFTDGILYKNFPYPVEDILDDVYIYLSVGFMQDRKGIKELLEGYLKAFYNQPNVLLWVHGPKSTYSDDRLHKELLPFACPQAPLILWTNKKVTNKELCDIYNFSDCYVTPHHLEGFGFGALQALACGKRVISTAYGGPLDYLPVKGVKLIPVKEGTTTVDNVDGRVPYCRFKLDDLIGALRNPPKEPPDKLQGWSWEASAMAFKEHLVAPGQIEKTYPGITICIPCWKDAPALRQLLHSINTIPAGMPYKIIVANDGADRMVSQVIVAAGATEISLAVRRSLGYVRNHLAAAVRTDYVVFLDCDTIITTPHWLSEWFYSHQKLGANTISGILQFSQDGKINYAGHPKIEKPSYFEGQQVSMAAVQSRKIIYVQGSSMMLETAIVHAYPWSESFHLYYDDVDFCQYAKCHGAKLRFIPSVSLIHTEHSTNKHSPDDTSNPLKVGIKTYKEIWQGTEPAV